MAAGFRQSVKSNRKPLPASSIVEDPLTQFPFLNSGIQTSGGQLNQPRFVGEPPLAQPGGVGGTANINDVLFNINQPVNFDALPTFSQPEIDISSAQNILAPAGGVRPETQRILDIISQQTGEGVSRAASEAQALASRRGIAGSSIEAFGTGQAIGEVERASREAEANILLENLRQDEAAKRLSAELEASKSGQLAQLTNQQEIAQLQAEANRGNQKAQIELQQRLSSASAIQDEIASLRNIDFGQQQLKLEQDIQNRTLAIMQENINMSREAAEKQAEVDILNSTIGIFGPAIAQKMFFGNQSVNMAAIPGVAAFPAATGAGTLGIPLANAGTAGAGAAGTGTAGAAGAGAGAGLATLGAGLAGGIAGQFAFRPTQKGDALGSGIGSGVGAGLGAAFGGPAGAAAGGFVGAGVGKFASRRIRGISKLIRGEGTRSTKNVEREVKKGINKIGKSLGFK